MAIRILEIDALPTKFPFHSAQDTRAGFLKMSIPLIYILRRSDGETEVLFQTIAVLKKGLARAVSRDYAMRFFRVDRYILMSLAYFEEK